MVVFYIFLVLEFLVIMLAKGKFLAKLIGLKENMLFAGRKCTHSVVLLLLLVMGSI